MFVRTIVNMKTTQIHAFLRVAAGAMFLVMADAPLFAQGSKPNVLLMILEDWGPDLGCYGEKSMHTPHLDQLAAEIRGATNQWVELQSQTTQAASSAKQVADGLAGEAKALTKFMQRSDETEKTHLRLEVEKLRRGEAERLQVIIHVLDHVFALFQAAERSGHPDLIDQLGHFQKACLETVRRIGLVQMGVEAGQAYDPELHKLQDNAAAVENGLVAETVAAGYTYQGQMLRRPVVALKESLK